MPNSVGYDATFLIPEYDDEEPEACQDCKCYMEFDGRFWRCPECGAVIAVEGADDNLADLIEEYEKEERRE